MSLRPPIIITAQDYPDWINMIEGPSFEDFFRAADENFQRGDLRINVWQNTAFNGQTAVPENSAYFDIQKRESTPRKAIHKRDHENIHIDAEKARVADPQKFFNGSIIRVAEQYEGYGTSLYWPDLKDDFARAMHGRLRAMLKPFKLDASNDEHNSIKGPVRLSEGQAALMLKRNGGNHATMHAVPAQWQNEGSRQTLLTDLLPHDRILD